jgi:hypothetical protein
VLDDFMRYLSDFERLYWNVLDVIGLISGGGRGIRTPGTVSGAVVFKTTAIDHSAIPPRRNVARIRKS